MTSEAYHGRTDDGYGPNEYKTRQEYNELIDTTHTDLVDRINRFLNDPSPSPGNSVRKGTQSKVRESLQVIQKALKDYGFDALALSFNGGKDCLVLLILYIYVLHQQQHPSRRGIPTCFVTPPQTFKEIDDFVTDCSTRYNLDVERIALPMKPAFTQYLNNHSRVKAVLVGTRRTDPHGGLLTHFDPTDHGWPPFMRVHPVIDWHYWEIWDFLRALKVPYCVLYDRGYNTACDRVDCRFTSLGGTLDTHPNPLLRNADGEGFKPAYELLDESQERYGRNWQIK